MNRKIIILVTLILLGCTKSSRDHTGKTAAEPGIDKIKLTELDGTAIDFSQFKGKTVFINFWATWCKPCIMEMPTIASLQEKLKSDNVIFLLASNEGVNEIDQFGKRRGFNFHYVHLENMESLNIQALPTTFIFDPEGNLKFSEAGYRTWDNSENIELVKNVMIHKE